ncbi:Putative Flp pilus-assembly TadE/G-like [Sphingomonas guangdongensis]|uniref:Flp pilus-assembly TadE/G-like n=1 Tax=Sphingomonas guangdongensis TaxID=1141890 RepID=A0A285R0E4_9SPHN|nr:Tad domain-containing protein [Sphingomonas guangdongensis]SOB87571.1 Putative Flp pilus-assembly TadE/G-like [Sphingomonas guangdongensis]
MSKATTPSSEQPRGFLSRLLHDVRANTMIVMTAALIPLIGMVGGGLDISRMYILKTRLQHACDAGALAGRRAMGGGTWSYSNYYPRTQANLFFDANFDEGSFASHDLKREFTENAGKVSGKVSAEIPMTLMRVFGLKTDNIAVECDAEMRLPNTDVMFVLDTTGSMADAQPGDTVNKMSALKTAVKCFYEIVARLDTNANCTTGTPGGGTGGQVQIRFGFVPYATNVNVGYLLKPEWFADSWDYQTRAPVDVPGEWKPDRQEERSRQPISQTGVPQNMCNNQTAAAYGYNSQTGYTSVDAENRYYEKTEVNVTSWNSANGGTCSGNRITTRYYEKLEKTYQQWKYAKLPVTVSLLKSGSTWNRDFKWKVNNNFTDKTIRWDGCVEERETTRDTNYDPIPSGAKDLDIDSIPVPGDRSTQWGMVLPDLIFTRAQTSGGGGNIGNWTMAEQITSTNYNNTSVYSCPVEARKMQEWPVASAFTSYVDQLNPSGNTYHDIGLIWGARLLSPTGLFRDENEFTPKGAEIERHLIFMTDGDACTENYNYTSYGVEWFDRRRTNQNTVPTDGCTTNTPTLTQQVNKRTEGLCTAIKNKNITLWVIAFGNLAATTEKRLSDCATPGRYFKATSSAALQQTFKNIADQISMLRLTN